MAAKKKSARKPAKKSAVKSVEKFMNNENVRRYGQLTGKIMIGAVRAMKTAKGQTGGGRAARSSGRRSAS